MGQAKGIETRQRILDTAQAMMTAKKGALVNMSDIAGATGLSRQALYQHFHSRTELLLATMREIDLGLDLATRLKPMQEAPNGVAKLAAFIAFWGRYLPEFEGAARALRAASREDEAARAAWDERMSALRQSCSSTIMQVAQEGNLALDWTSDSATALLCSILSFDTWDHLVNECGWTEDTYVDTMQALARRAFIRPDTL